MTSRHDLLQWINDTLGLNYSKVEQFASGAAACQLCDVIWPGEVQIKKVKFHAKHEHEYVHNYKILQQIFNKKGIEKVVNVDNLIKGKFQENLMFAQWLKTFFDQRYSGNDGDAAQRRKATGAPSGAPRRAAAAPKGAKPAGTSAAARTAVGSRATTTKASAPKPRVADAQMEQLTQELAEVKITTEGLEKERDFYFEKLRQIEVTCDSDDNMSLEKLKECIKEILYAVEPGFEHPDSAEGGPLEATPPLVDLNEEF